MNEEPISSIEQCEKLKIEMIERLEESKALLVKLLQENSASEVFKKMKFEKTVIDPLKGTDENLIEVINQAQTYLVSLEGVKYLLSKHSGNSFELNLGNKPGSDIYSEDESIIAECFAATNIRSNNKLKKDLDKLSEKNAEYRYEFFYDLESNDEKLKPFREKYPDITIIKVEI